MIFSSFKFCDMLMIFMGFYKFLGFSYLKDLFEFV